MNGSNSYAERQTVANKGEVLFQEWCQFNGYQVSRIGFDEKHGNVANFFNLPCLLRNLPDFVISRGDETMVVNVKGTANFKEKEIKMIPMFLEWFSSKKAPLVYAFCFEECEPLFIYPEKVIYLYEKAQNRKWNDGVIYRNLNFMELL